jgi:hypothetical protein
MQKERERRKSGSLMAYIWLEMTAQHKCAGSHLLFTTGRNITAITIL